MPDFSLVGGNGVRVETVGADTSTSQPTLIAPSASANTKGSYVELTSATAFEHSSIVLQYANGDNAATAAVDIAIGGAGSEEIIIEDLLIGQLTGNSNVPLGGSLHIPISIPAGSRVAVRSQVSKASGIGPSVMFLGMSSTFADTPGVQRAEVIGGYNSGTTEGTLVDPGTTLNTKNTYVEMNASTSRNYKGFFLVWDFDQDISLSAIDFLADVAIGGAGSEEVIVNNMYMTSESLADSISQSFTVYPIAIPSGTRVALRTQCNSNNANRQINASVYGIY